MTGDVKQQVLSRNERNTVDEKKESNGTASKDCKRARVVSESESG